MGWGRLVALGAALTVASASPAAAARLSAGVPVSPVHGGASEPAVGLGADGRAALAWIAPAGRVVIAEGPGTRTYEASGELEARLGRAGGQWGALQRIAAHAFGPRIAVGANGTAALSWESPTRTGRALYVSIAPPGGRFATPKRVTLSFGIYPVGLEVQPEGRVVLIWTRTLQYSLTIINSELEYALIDGTRAAVARNMLRVIGTAEATATSTAAGTILIASAPKYEPPSGNIEQLAALAPGARAFTDQGTIDLIGGVDSANLEAGPGGQGLAAVLNRFQPSFRTEALFYPLSGEGAAQAPIAVGESSTVAANESSIRPAALQVGLPAGGELLATWSRQWVNSPGVGGLGRAALRASELTPGASGFSAPVTLGETGLALAPQVYASGSSAVLLWAENLPHCRQRVYASVWSGPGALEDARALGPPSPATLQCADGQGQIAGAGSASDALLAWLQGTRIDVASLSP